MSNATMEKNETSDVLMIDSEMGQSVEVTMEEIQARVKEIQSSWSPQERLARSVIGQARRDQLFALMNDVSETERAA